MFPLASYNWNDNTNAGVWFRNFIRYRYSGNYYVGFRAAD